MKQLLEKLFNGGQLIEREAHDIIIRIAHGDCMAAQVAAFLTVFRMRHLSIAELSGFRDGLFSLAKKVDLNSHEAVDVCGTGGDGKNSYNVSTAVAFVVAGCGIKVAKHGNHSLSSASGSSTVLEHLGVVFSDKSDLLNQQLERANVCFLHAPLFHPLLKNVASIRKELGVKTFLNLLGPLLSPASVSTQLIGVYNLELGRLLRYYFQSREGSVIIVHSLDGFDEVSLSAPAHVLGRDTEFTLEARDFGLAPVAATAILSTGGVAENARELVDLLDNRGIPAYRSVVIANSALAIQLKRPGLGLKEAALMAAESLDSGRAKRSFDLLRSE